MSIIIKGDVYVSKSKYIGYALIAEGVSKDGFVLVSDITSRDLMHDFVPVQLGEKEEDFLGQYEKAKPEQLVRFLAELREKHSVIGQKISHLEQYVKGQTPVDVEQLIRATEQMLELNRMAQNASKSLPLHTSEGVLGMGPSDDEAHYEVYNEENE